MRQLSFPALALVVALAATPAAGSTPDQEPAPQQPVQSTGLSATAVTDHLKCVVTELRDDHVLKVWDEDKERSHLIRVGEDVEIKARRKKDFDGRSTLEFADLLPGHRLKVTYRIADGTILEVKVLEKLDKLPAGAEL